MKSTYTTRQKRTQRDYTLAFKLSVVAQVEKGEMSYKQAQQRYGIQGRSTVLTWLRKHGKLNWSTPVKLAMNKTPSVQETPEQKIKRLERELEDARLHNLLLDEMITILDRDHGAGLRKSCKPRSEKLPSAR